jgi:hypothetical protein
MSRDGESKDPWLEKFHAQCDAMDANLIARFDDFDAKAARIMDLNATLIEQLISSVDNLAHQIHRSKSRL